MVFLQRAYVLIAYVLFCFVNRGIIRRVRCLIIIENILILFFVAVMIHYILLYAHPTKLYG